MRTRLILPLLIAAALGACDSLLGPVPVDIELVGVPSSVRAGQTVALRVVVRDGAGHEVDHPDVEWSSSDPTAAVVEDGMLRALDAGVVDIQAKVGISSARARVNVHFSDLGVGALGIRVQGSDARHRSSGNAFLREPMAWEELGGDAAHRPAETHIFSASGIDGVLLPGDYYGLFAEHFPADTVLWLTLQSAPVRGQTSYRTVPPQVRSDGTLVPYVTDRAMLRIRDPLNPDRTVVYVALDRIHVDIQEVRAPDPGAFPGDGWVRGSVAFEAAGLIIEGSGGGNPRVVGQVSGSTTRVYGEFDLPLNGWPMGVVRSIWSGGRFESDTTLSTVSPSWRSPGTAEGWQVRWVSSIWQGPALVDNFGMRLQYSPDETAFRPVGPESVSYTEGTPGTWVWGTLSVGNAGVLTQEAGLFPADGGLDVTRFEEPTTTRLGTLAGTATTNLRLYDPAGTATGDTVRLTAEVMVPLVPPDAGPLR